jgi:hypothetical protein
MKTLATRRSLVLAAAVAPLCGPVPKATAASFDLSGRWVYRSFHNVSDPAEDFGKLRLALGTMEVPEFTGHEFAGTLVNANWQLSLAGKVEGGRVTMRATQGSPNTAGWIYDYVGWLAPRWPNAIDQVPTIVGSVLRVVDHGTSKGGATYSFILVKQS